MTRIEIASEATSPIGEAQVGQTIRITGTAYVYAVNESLIDISVPGGPPETLPGDRTYQLISQDIQLHPDAPCGPKIGEDENGHPIYGPVEELMRPE